MRAVVLSVALLPACGPIAAPLEPSVEPLPAVDLLDDPDFAAEAFLRVRASADLDEETFTWWKGEIFELRTDQPSASRRSLLGFEGFNVARVVPTDDGWRLITREITVYTDPEGRIIDCWAPEGEVPRPVLHVQNDPVSFDLGAPPPHRVLDDRVLWSLSFPLAYPSPLPVAEYPEASAGDIYRSVEQFDFEVALADLADPGLGSVPTRIVWSRLGPWLPWMRRGQQPGWLVYHATGRKLEGGFEALPEPLRSWTLEHAPEYRHAPERDEGPNQTSWTVYRDAVDAGVLPERCVPSE
jgi:hypothetical protein